MSLHEQPPRVLLQALMDSNLPRLQLELYKEIKKVGFDFLLLSKWYCFPGLSSACEILSFIYQVGMLDRNAPGKVDFTALFSFTRFLFLICEVGWELSFLSL